MQRTTLATTPRRQHVEIPSTQPNCRLSGNEDRYEPSHAYGQIKILAKLRSTDLHSVGIVPLLYVLRRPQILPRYQVMKRFTSFPEKPVLFTHFSPWGQRNLFPTVHKLPTMTDTVLTGWQSVLTALPMGDFTFWISLSRSLSLRPDFRLRPNLIQKVSLSENSTLRSPRRRYALEKNKFKEIQLLQGCAITSHQVNCAKSNLQGSFAVILTSKSVIKISIKTPTPTTSYIFTAVFLLARWLEKLSMNNEYSR